MTEFGLFLQGETILQLALRSSDPGGKLSAPLNAIWFRPNFNKQTTLRICATEAEPNNEGKLIAIDDKIPGCTFSNSFITVTKQGFYALQVILGTIDGNCTEKN